VSEQNVERAREGYEALSRAVEGGDLDGFLGAYAHPNMEWIPLPGSPDSVAIRRGHAEVRERFAEMLEAVDEPRIEAQEFIDAGDRTVVGVRISGRGKASGIEVEGHLFHVVTEEHGRLLRIEWYAGREEALKAAGLQHG
jgi:ketosteroid isomerase-like protein